MVNTQLNLAPSESAESSSGFPSAPRPASSNLSASSTRVPHPPTKSVKSQYTEAEAAEELGIGVETLRNLVRSHVVDRDEDVGNLPATSFQPSDLLVLRLLSGMNRGTSE